MFNLRNSCRRFKSNQIIRPQTADCWLNIEILNIWLLWLKPMVSKVFWYTPNITFSHSYTPNYKYDENNHPLNLSVKKHGLEYIVFLVLLMMMRCYTYSSVWPHLSVIFERRLQSLVTVLILFNGMDVASNKIPSWEDLWVLIDSNNYC